MPPVNCVISSSGVPRLARFSLSVIMYSIGKYMVKKGEVKGGGVRAPTFEIFPVFFLGELGLDQTEAVDNVNNGLGVIIERLSASLGRIVGTDIYITYVSVSQTLLGTVYRTYRHRRHY